MILGGYTTPNVWDHDNHNLLWTLFIKRDEETKRRFRRFAWLVDLDLRPKICAELIAPLGTEKPMNRCLCNMFLHLNLFRPSQLCPNPRIAFLVGPWINTFTYKSVALPRVKQILAQITYLFRFDGPMAMEREREINIWRKLHEVVPL